MTDTQRPAPKLPDPYPPAPKKRLRSKMAIISGVVVGALALWAALSIILISVMGPKHPSVSTAPQPTITVTTTVTPKPVAPSRIVTLEDIIQGCANAMARASQIELYESRPKACAQLGEPEFQRASAIAIPLIMAQYDTPAP